MKQLEIWDGGGWVVLEGRVHGALMDMLDGVRGCSVRAERTLSGLWVHDDDGKYDIRVVDEG